MTRDTLAAEIFKNAVSGAENLSRYSEEDRRDLFDVVAKYSVEMADALFRRLNNVQ